MYTGQLAQRLAQSDLLMSEQCLKLNGEHLPATFVEGSWAIDAVFATTGVEVVNAGLLPKRGGVGNHRCFILDFTSASVFGTVNPRVAPASGRKLHCDCKRIRTSYNDVLGQLADQHRMFKKIDDLTKLSKDMTVSEFQVKINRWDDEMTDYMRAAENKCRKFKHTHIEWSPDVGVWIRRRRLLERVGKYIDGRVPDPRNLTRACKKQRYSGS